MAQTRLSVLLSFLFLDTWSDWDQTRSCQQARQVLYSLYSLAPEAGLELAYISKMNINLSTTINSLQFKISDVLLLAVLRDTSSSAQGLFLVSVLRDHDSTGKVQRTT